MGRVIRVWCVAHSFADAERCCSGRADQRARFVNRAGIPPLPEARSLGHVVVTYKKFAAIINQVTTFHNRFQERKPRSPIMTNTTPTPKQTPALEPEAPRIK